MTGTQSNMQVGIAPQRPLPSSIDTLTSAISSLESTMYSLSSRLSPVLDIVASDTGRNEPGPPIEPPHHYQEQILRLTARVFDLKSLASDLIDRLHV